MEEQVTRKKAGRPALGEHGKVLRIDMRVSAAWVALIDAARQDTGLSRSAYVIEAAKAIAAAALRGRLPQEPDQPDDEDGI